MSFRAAGFDLIIVETVRSWSEWSWNCQSGWYYSGVVVPESGDEVQTLKSGIMEIADIFVVNKSDREELNIYNRTWKTDVTSQTWKLDGSGY